MIKFEVKANDSFLNTFIKEKLNDANIDMNDMVSLIDNARKNHSDIFNNPNITNDEYAKKHIVALRTSNDMSFSRFKLWCVILGLESELSIMQ
jgi:hypothetical protein